MRQTTAPPIAGEIDKLLGSGRAIVLEDELRLHSYDTWPVASKWRLQGKSPFRPDVVVRPTSVDEVSRLLAWATANRIAVTPWGLGSSVTGAPLPMRGGVVLDMTQQARILLVDDVNLFVKVQAGKLGIELEKELNAVGLSLNHSPQSLDRSTVGGWVATRATGQFSSAYGGIEDLVLALTVVLPSGEVVETPLVPRAATGPDVGQLFVGAEGTLGVVVDVTLKVFALPEHRRLETIRFATVDEGLLAMRQIMRAGLRPFLVRFYDADEARHAMVDPAFEGCVMFLGVEGLAAVAEAELAASLDICASHGGRAIGPDGAEAWMARRFDFSTIEARIEAPGGVAETIEVAQFWDQILDTYNALKTALKPYATEVLGHFSHVYPQGTALYLILLGEVADDVEAEAQIHRIWDVAMRTSLDHGAAISHHHGVGLARLPYIREGLGSSMVVLEHVKTALDPAGIMNPGKLGLD